MSNSIITQSGLLTKSDSKTLGVRGDLWYNASVLDSWDEDRTAAKLVNPQNPEARYQCNLQMILIGSKE